MVSVLLEDRNLLFVHVPKTGGGSISRLLRTEPDAKTYPVQNMSVARPCVQQLSEQLDQPLSKYRTVAFVRNPWDWTVSGYLHMTESMPAYEQPPTFRDFILGDWTGATRLHYPTKFTTPQAYVAYHTQITPWEHLFLSGENVKIDTLCAFETLDRDARNALGLEIPLPHVNRSERTHYSQYFDDETEVEIANRHAELIEKCGYVFVRP
ncbi:MAG: sulfotransferase family protein [Alphaproteobacteria bacterium]|nr:sulfotransferase family protein [Alphaproteobacteria bacterium]